MSQYARCYPRQNRVTLEASAPTCGKPPTLARRAANAGSLLFFVASKIFWIFFSPVAVLLIAAFVGVLWSKGRFVGMGRAIAVVSMLALIVSAMTPLGLILVSPLEDRIPEPLATCPLLTESWCWGARSTARSARCVARL